jgi:anti-sigma regulatory factor (Ser/Thr protein kinase)
LSNGTHAFHHEALFYAGDEGFLAGTLPFVRDSVWADEPVLVAVSKAKADALKHELGDEAEAVHFADMAELGRNPACIIPAWHEFVQAYGAGGRPLRGIGEPIWHGRSDAELTECHRHESLLNLAFENTPAFWLLCPYDKQALPDDVLDEALRTHPYIADPRESRRNEAYVPPELSNGPFEGELPSPAEAPAELSFHRDRLRAVREFVTEWSGRRGLPEERTADLVLAVNELATNSVLHAGGGGTLRLWQENGALLAEVHDQGRLNEPLLGRERPTPDQASGRGLWLVNNLCDLVQMRTLPSGTVVRLHMELG